MAELVQKIYANSLFQVALEQDSLENIFKELNEIDNILENDYVKILSSPVMEKEVKHNLIKEAFGESLCSFTLNYLDLLIDNDRFDCIFTIKDEFNSLYNEHNGILEVEAIVASEMSWELKARLIARLEKETAKTIRLKTKVDPTILGGIKLQYNNTEVDASVKTKLEDIKQSIRQITL